MAHAGNCRRTPRHGALALLVVAATGSFQCWTHPSQRTTEPPLTPAAGVASEARPQRRLTDGEILGVLEAVNTFEAERANLALQRATSPELESYARMLLDYHTDVKLLHSEHSGRRRQWPEDGREAVSLRAEYVDDLTRLRATEREHFDASYADSEVRSLEKLRALLDEVLLPNVRAQELWQLLQIMRLEVDVHLSQALELRRGLAAVQRP